ncbi:MAG: hypothetical protein JWM38_2319 [Sphingomonas bacterium]|nr:hypothetical protein [Sphingomonas bacterium]
MGTVSSDAAVAIPLPGDGAAPPAAPPLDYPRARTAWFGLTMIGLVTVFGQLDRAIFYLLVSPIKRDLALSDTQMSILMGAAYSVAYFLVGLPMARLTDVGTRKFILPGALALWSFGTACCALAGNFVQFFIARALVGGGESVKGPCAVSMISDLFPKNKLPTAFAAYNFSIRGGEALALIIGGLLIGYFASIEPVTLPFFGEFRGWHIIFMIFGTPGIVLAVIFLLTVPEPKRQGRSRKGSVPLRELAHFLFKSPARRVLIPILLAAALHNIEMVGIGSWRPTFYERTYGVGPAEFGPIMGTAALIITPFGLFLGAFLAEHLAKKGYDDAFMRVVIWANLLGVPLGIVSPLMPTFELALVCSLGAALLVSMSAPSQLAAMQVVTPNELRGQINAIYMFTLSVIGLGLGPTVIALMTDYLFQSEADLRYAMVTAAAVAGPISLALLWMSLKPYGRLSREANLA